MIFMYLRACVINCEVLIFVTKLGTSIPRFHFREDHVRYDGTVTKPNFFLGIKMWIRSPVDVSILDDRGSSSCCDIIHSSDFISTFGCPRHRKSMQCISQRDQHDVHRWIHVFDLLSQVCWYLVPLSTTIILTFSELTAVDN